MKARTMIVDDEPLARVRMRSLLEKYSEDLEIIDEAGSGAQAISKINELTPDVVFLDIQMPDMDAFEVLKNVDEDVMPLIVFTTAYENFALRAYEENTVDYLLKPVDPERLEATMEKLRKRLPDIEATNQMPADFSWEKFRSLMAMGDQYLQRIQVKIGDRILLERGRDYPLPQRGEVYDRLYADEPVHHRHSARGSREEARPAPVCACAPCTSRSHRLHRRNPQVGHEPPECGAARQGPHADSGEPQLREVRTQSLVNYGTESE